MFQIMASKLGVPCSPCVVEDSFLWGYTVSTNSAVCVNFLVSDFKEKYKLDSTNDICLVIDLMNLADQE
jgi:hypothetical protein